MKKAFYRPYHSQLPVEADTAAAEAQVQLLEGHLVSTEGLAVKRSSGEGSGVTSVPHRVTSMTDLGSNVPSVV